MQAAASESILDLSINNIRSFKQRRKNNNNISPTDSPLLKQQVNSGVHKRTQSNQRQRILQKCQTPGNLIQNGIIPSSIDLEAARLDNSEDFLMDCVEKLTDEVASIKRTLVELPQRILSGLHVFIQSEIESQFQILQNRVTAHVTSALANSGTASEPINITTGGATGQVHPNIPQMPKYIQAPVQIRIEDLRADCHVHRVKILDSSPPSDVFELSDDFIYRVFLKYKYPSIFVQALFVLHFGSYKAMHLNTSSRVKNNLELIPENFVTRLTLLVVRWFPNVEDLDFGKCLNQKQRSILSAARSCLFFKKCDSCKTRNIESLPSTYMKVPAENERNIKKESKLSAMDLVKSDLLGQTSVSFLPQIEKPMGDDLIGSLVDQLSVVVKEEMSPTESANSSNAENQNSSPE